MLLARYRHPLPADYDMDRIRDRIAARAPEWDDARGLVFKAFVLEDRAKGARANAYGSLYLWSDPAAATAFFAGPRFQAVGDTFGRPRTEIWLPFAGRLGPAGQARSLAISERCLPPEADLAAEHRAEADRVAGFAAEADILAVVTGLDPTNWRLSRFVLRAAAPAPGDGEIGHLAAPDLAALREFRAPTL